MAMTDDAWLAAKAHVYAAAYAAAAVNPEVLDEHERAREAVERFVQMVKDHEEARAAAGDPPRRVDPPRCVKCDFPLGDNRVCACFFK